MAENSGDLSLGYMMGQSEGNNGGFGGLGDGWVGIILFALIFGWGRGGGGLFGGGGGGNDGVSAGFAWQGIDNGIRGIQQGLCDGFYAVNTGLLNGFHGVDNAICNLGYQTQTGFNSLATQLANCCCETQRAIDGVNYNMATQFCALGNTVQNSTRDIIDSQNAGTRAILDFLTNDKIDSLRAENQALKFAASQANQNAFITANQEAQTAELIRRLGRDCPVPAYVVPNPNCCYGNPVGVGYNGAGYGGCACA
jgi:hypothetical protein